MKTLVVQEIFYAGPVSKGTFVKFSKIFEFLLIE
jgi:hypothetical protein